MKTLPLASKQPQIFQNQSVVQSPARDSQVSAQPSEQKGAISHFRRVVNRQNYHEEPVSPARGTQSGIRASERSGGSGQYLHTENANANIDDEGPNKGISLICSPSPRQQMSPYHLQHHHRATNTKRPQTNYEGEVLSSSNPDPAETGGEESFMQHDEHDGYPGDHSGEQYINQIKPWKKNPAHVQSANESLRFSHQHANDLGGSDVADNVANNVTIQRGRWQRRTSNSNGRHAQSKNDDYEVQEEAYNAKKPRGTAEISTMQNHQITDNAQSEELYPFGVGAGIIGGHSKNQESTDKGMSSEPNNNQVCQSGRTSHRGAQGSFYPNGPYYIRESQGNDESQLSGLGAGGRMKGHTDKSKVARGYPQGQRSHSHPDENQDGEHEQISEMSDDNNYSSPSQSSPRYNYGDESCAEKFKTSGDANHTDDQGHTENADEDDELTLKERINRKQKKLKGKITQFYERDKIIKTTPPSSHQAYQEQVKLHNKNKQNQSGVPNRYSRHSGPLLNALMSENSCQNLTLQQSRDSNKLEVENIQPNLLNRSSNNEFIDASNYRTEPSAQNHNTVRKSDASFPGGTFTNPADDRPIRPSSILRMFGHPEDHALGALKPQEASNIMTAHQREKDKQSLNKNPLLVKKTIDLNENNAQESIGPFQSSTSQRDSFLDSKRAKQQSMSKLNSTHAGPRLYSQQSMAQGAESSKNLQSPARYLGASNRNTTSRVSPTKKIKQASRSKGRDSSSSLRPMATTLYTKLLSNQNCESLTAQPRIDRIDFNANQKMKKMNRNLLDKHQNRSPSALSKPGQRSQQTGKQNAKTNKTHAHIKKINMEKLMPMNKLQLSQYQMQMNTDRTHQQASTMLSFGEKHTSGAGDRQRSGAPHKEQGFILNSMKNSGRLTGQDTLMGPSMPNYLLKKASIDISSSCITVSERSKRSLQKSKQNSRSPQKVPVPDMRLAQLSDPSKVYKKVSSKYNIGQSPKQQTKRALHAGQSPQNCKTQTLQSLDQENTDMEDYGASYIVVNKIKSQMMTHTDKNKFNKKVNALTHSRNAKAVHSHLQKSRKDLGQTPAMQQKQVSSKPGHYISYKDFEKQKKDRSLNSAAQLPNTAQMLREANVNKKPSQKAKPSAFKTIPATTYMASLQHSKSNQLGINYQSMNSMKVIGQQTLNATQKQTTNQAQRNSEKVPHELQLNKKYSNNQIKGMGTTGGNSPTSVSKPHPLITSSKTSTYASNPMGNIVHSVKSKGASHLPQKMNYSMTPKGQKQATRLQKMQKNHQADQPAIDEKDLMEEDIMAAGPGSGYESMNTFMKAKTYKDLKEKIDQNTKHARDSRRTHPINPGNKLSQNVTQTANNEQRRKNTKKDQSPTKTTGAQHSGNNQDPPNFQHQRQSKMSRGSNKAAESANISRNVAIQQNHQEYIDNQSHKRSILSTQASRGFNHIQNSKNQSPARQIGNRTSHIIQEDKLGLQSQLSAPGHNQASIAVNFGQLISNNQQSYVQVQPNALTQRVSMPLNDRKNLYLSDREMILIEQQQTSQQSILKKNRSSKSPLMTLQRDGQPTGTADICQQDHQPSFAAPQHQQFNLNGSKNQYAMQQKQLSIVTLAASKPGQVPLQRRDRSLTDHVPASNEISNSKVAVHLDKEVHNSSRNPNRVRFQESLKDLQTHRSLRQANMSVTSGGGQSGGNLSQHRELTNLNLMRDQKKISKSIQRGCSIGRFGSQQSDKVAEDAIEYNDINSKNDDLYQIDDRIGEKMNEIQDQLNRMNELSLERKNSTSRRRLRSNSFQRPNALENQIATMKTSSQHSTSQRELFQQQRQQALPFQNLAANPSANGLRPFSAHHSRLNSMQYQTAAAMNAEPRQRFQRQDSLNLSQDLQHHRQAASEMKDQGQAVANLTQMNTNYNFNSTTKKVMIDLSIQGGGHLSSLPGQQQDQQQSTQNIRKFRPQMMPSFSSQQPYFQQPMNGPASTGSGEFEIHNVGAMQMPGHVSTSSIGVSNQADGYQSHKMPLRASLGDQYAPQPLLQTMQIEGSHVEGALHLSSSPGATANPANATGGPGPRINRQMSGRSSNSSPKNQFGFQPRDSKSRKRIQDTLAKQASANNCKPPVPHQAMTEKMSRDLLMNSIPAQQPLHTQVFNDDPLDQERDFIIAAIDNNPGYYSASGEANVKRSKHIKKGGQTSKSSLNTQKQAYGASATSGDNTHSQQNSNHQSKGSGTANLHQLSSARQKLKNQTQHIPSGTFVMTAGPGTLTGGHLAHIGPNFEAYPSQAAMGPSNAKMYQTDYSDQPTQQPPSSAFAAADQSNAQGLQSVRVQSERYLSSAGNGSQQSQSSKMLKTKKRTAKY